MYKSKKKIIVISTLSLLSLGGIVTAAYFIANSFDTKEVQDKTPALYFGATSALENPLFNPNPATSIANASLSDWIFSNMPTRINFSKEVTSLTKTYTIEFIDYRYDPSKISEGFMICSIDFLVNPTGFEYVISTPTNIPNVPPMQIGSLKFDSSDINVNNYTLTNFISKVPVTTTISLNKTTGAPNDFESFTNPSVGQYTIDRTIYTAATPSPSDLIFNYSIKDNSSTNTSPIYTNAIQKTNQTDFKMLFAKPQYNTILNADIKRATVSETNKFSYDLSYTGTSTNQSITDYKAYAPFWTSINTGIHMPEIFGSIGLLDWVTKIA